MFGIGYAETEQCSITSNGSQKERCQIDIVTIGDKSVPREEKTQVYISGALHGNERLGPDISFYLIEYLVTHYGSDPHITTLLKTREIIITPMTNAVGYSQNMRTEKQGNS